MRLRPTWNYARIVFLPSLIIIGLTGCENTLIYGERTGFNLSIHVNDDPATPLRVNAGLERSAAASVPPTQASGQSEGEAVNLFSGFKLKYTEEETSAFGGTLTIRTQFSSGAAALAIAQGSLADEAVSQIVKTVEFERDKEFLDALRQQQVDQLFEQIDALDPQTAIELEGAPPVRSEEIDSLVGATDPNNRRETDGTIAKQMLKMRIAIGDRSDADLESWKSAIEALQ